MIVPIMGTIPDISIATVLFTRTQRGVLALLFGVPERSYYVNEIVRSAGLGVGTVQRELEALSSCGLVSVESVGNQKHYRANMRAPIFEELRGIVQKTFGLVDVLRELLAPVASQIELAFVFGSVAKGTDRADSDVGLMVVSEQLGFVDIADIAIDARLRLGREVNPVVYKGADFRRKLREDQGFVARVMDRPRMDLIGSSDDLQEPRKSRKNRKPDAGSA
jgi:predicted nucleotidyltransferase